MTDADERAFLNAIAADPGDDTPRLAFADFLDERGGDADRSQAAFIRAEVELARTDEADPAYPELLARARRSGVLTRPDRVPWRDAVPGAKVAFRRGLIGAVWLDPHIHAQHDLGDWARLPVEHLGWRSDRGGEGNWDAALGSALAARPELERLPSLEVNAPAAFLDPLLTGGRLTELRALNVGNSNDRSEAEQRQMAAVAGRVSLTALDSLRVWTHWPTREWEPLVRASGSGLRRLSLASWCERRTLDEDGRDLYWDEIEGCFWFHEISFPLTFGVVTLATWNDYGSVNHVWTVGDPSSGEHYFRNSSTPGETVALPHLPALRRLHLESDSENAGNGEVSHLPEAAQLEWFSSDHLCHEERRFAAGTQLRNLRRLSLYFSAPAILQGEYCQRLLRLDWRNDAGSRGFEALRAAELPELRWLTLNGIGQSEVRVGLPTATNMPNLCTLVLSHFPGDADSRNELLARLATARGLPHLSLVGIGLHSERQWWVLGDGRATPVPSTIDPVWRDWWEFDPTEEWF